MQRLAAWARRADALLERSTRRLPLILRRNFRLKALSAALALVAWTVVVYASNPPDTRTIGVDVPTDNLSSPFILDPAPGQIAVRVRGTTEHLNQFSAHDLKVTAAFDKVRQTGAQDVPLSVVNTDPDVELDSVPASIGVNIDQLDSRSLVVSVIVATKSGKSLKPPPGYILGEMTSTPPDVTVTGPKHRIDSIPGLHAVADVDLSNARTTYAATEDVVLRDATGASITDLSVNPASVAVRVAITSNTVARASAIVPDLTGTAGFGRVLSGITIAPQNFTVLTGPQDLLNTINTVSTDPIRLTGLFSGEKVSVKIIVPAGVTADPATVDVTLFFALLPPPTPSPSPATTATPAPASPTPATTTTTTSTTTSPPSPSP